MTFDESKNIQWSSSNYVKVPVELELSKLQSRDDLAEKYAKHSKEGLSVGFDDFYQSYGVPQSLPCLRACLAVLNLINQRQSPGRRKRFHRSRSGESQSAETEQDGDRQTVSFDMLEYYEAYGLEGSGGKAAVEANQGLRMLQKPRYLEVTDWTTRCKQLLHEPLITVLFRGDQARNPRLTVKLGEALNRGRNSFWVHKPVTWYTDIATALRGKRNTLHILLFLDYLQTLDGIFPIRYETLASKLRLPYPRSKRTMTKMNKAIEIAYRLGFILKPAQYLRPSDMVEFELNPAMCKRYGRKQKRDDDGGTMHRAMQDGREHGDDDDELANFTLPDDWETEWLGRR